MSTVSEKENFQGSICHILFLNNREQQFNTIMDIVDEDGDSVKYTEHILNASFTSGYLNLILNKDKKEIEDILFADSISINDNDNDKDNDNDNDIEIIQYNVQTENLSQKLSQLSTENDNNEIEPPIVTYKRQRSSSATPSTPNIITKKIKMIDDSDVIDDNDIDNNTSTEHRQIPRFFSITNQTFESIMKKVLHTARTDSLQMNDLQQIALLTYRIHELYIDKEIKRIYLQSGTGTLKESESFKLIEIDRRVWPKQVQSEIIKKPIITITTMDRINPVSEHEDYENFVRQYLQKINDQIKQYQEQLDEKKKKLTGFTTTIEQAIQNYLNEYGIKPLQMKCDLKIALIKYDYIDEILERQYLQENPNEYQIQIAKRLCTTKNQVEKSKRELLELKQRVFYNKPPKSYDSIAQSILPSTTSSLSTTTTNDIYIQQHFINKYERIIKQKNLDTMAKHLHKAEIKYYQDENLFQDQLKEMWANHRNLVQNQEMSQTLTNILEQRFKNITDRWKHLYTYRINYYLKNSYDKLEDVSNNTNNNNNNNEKQEIKKIIGFMPCLLLSDTTIYPFNDKQLQLLNRGPTYVSPCQMFVSSLYPSIDDILKRQFAPLKHQLASLLTKHKVNIHLQMAFQNKLYQEFKNLFSLSIPSDIRQRTLYELKLIQTIQYTLKENNLILRRTADNMNTFYLVGRQDFETKADDYLKKSDAYEVILTMDNDDNANSDNNNNKNNEDKVQMKLKEIMEIINRGLKILKITKALKDDIVDKLLINTNNKKIQLSYLYFLPNVSQKNDNMVSLIPYITSEYSVTSKLAKYVNQLLRPFADDEMNSIIFLNEIDFIQKLIQYAHIEHRLTSTTTFCTIEFTNFYTLSTHRIMIDTIISFLNDHLASNRLNKIPIVTIKNLLELILSNNIFVYKEKIYQFLKGCPNTMPLSETLSHIYLFQWQKNLLNFINENNKRELFGRYKDKIFFTWNGSHDKLHQFIDILTQKYPNVQCQTIIGTNVHFLNAYIENQHGQLYTRVYHNPAIQNYILSYVIHHSTLQHSRWLQAALIRAVCYCSSVHDFQQQRIYLELTYLCNGYSVYFIECHIQNFFNYFHAETMRYLLDQTEYDKFRQQWFDLMNNQQKLSNKLQQIDNNGQLICLNYLYQYGPRCEFKKKFHDLWNKYFNTHSTLSEKNLTILLSTKHLYSSNDLLTNYNSYYHWKQSLE